MQPGMCPGCTGITIKMSNIRFPDHEMVSGKRLDFSVDLYHCIIKEKDKQIVVGTVWAVHRIWRHMFLITEHIYGKIVGLKRRIREKRMIGFHRFTFHTDENWCVCHYNEKC